MKVMGVDFIDSDETFDQMVVIYFTAPIGSTSGCVSELARACGPDRSRQSGPATRRLVAGWATAAATVLSPFLKTSSRSA